MSGTSLDGIDIALCEIDAKNCTLLTAEQYPFPKKLQGKLAHLILG